MRFRQTRLLAMLTVFLMALAGAGFSTLSGSPGAGCTVFADDPDQQAVRVLIIPKFEVGEAAGDFPGEAQLFYEHYCAGCSELAIPNSTPTAKYYFNQENGVGLLLTGAGKTAAGLSLMSLLSWDAYDFSDTLLVSVGCAGGSTGSCIFGDLVLVTAACDLELGHHTGSGELTDAERGLTWFPDDSSFNHYKCRLLNAELCEHAYQLIKDCPLRTTERTQHVLAENFPGEEWAGREPRVTKGTAVTADSYWKGEEDHANAVAAAEHYGCPDPYAVSEMEEIAILNAAACFGLQDRVLSLRVVVNMDTFLKGESAEGLWLEDEDFDTKVTEENTETTDIFEPAMQSLFDAAQLVIDDALAA